MAARARTAMRYRHDKSCDATMMSSKPTFAASQRSPQVSVVIPLRNEEDAISPLVAKLCASLAHIHFEIVLVDDGSTDATRSICLGLSAQDRRICIVGHDRSCGQSAALHSGVLFAKADVIATLDGDGQNPPENLPKLLDPMIGASADPLCGLVAGQRVGRKDSLSKRMASRFANALRSAVLRDGTRDTGCGLKAFRRDAFLALPYFNNMHRYLPALFAREGWRVAHVDVTHAPREFGSSKYGNLDRAIAGVADLAGVAWLIHRRKLGSPKLVSTPIAAIRPEETETYRRIV